MVPGTGRPILGNVSPAKFILFFFFNSQRNPSLFFLVHRLYRVIPVLPLWVNRNEAGDRIIPTASPRELAEILVPLQEAPMAHWGPNSHSSSWFAPV